MKKLILASAAAVALLGLAACGDSGNSAKETPPATTTEPATPPATTPPATTEPATPPASGGTTDPNAPKPADPAAPAQ